LPLSPWGEGWGEGSSAASFPAISIVPAKPRFEDAFVALLGGQPKRTQAFEVPARPANGGGDAVEATGLTKVFGDFTAADRISFKIERGEIFGLLGPNGAGKSTTFKMMCGLLRPTAGTARVDGYDLYSAPAVARGRLGYMAQKFSLYGDLSVRDQSTVLRRRLRAHRREKARRHRPRDCRLRSGAAPQD